MKRMSGLKRQIKKGVEKLSIDGLTPQEEFDACRREILGQKDILARVIRDEVRPALVEAGVPILDWQQLSDGQREAMRYGSFPSRFQPIETDGLPSRMRRDMSPSNRSWRQIWTGSFPRRRQCRSRSFG